MSLVNDALKKARLEAARGDAANRGLPYPALGRGENGSSGARIAGLGALMVLVALGGFFLFRAGKQSALRTDVPSTVQGSSSESSSGVSGDSGVSGSSADSAHLDTQPKTGKRENAANDDPPRAAERSKTRDTQGAQQTTTSPPTKGLGPAPPGKAAGDANPVAARPEPKKQQFADAVPSAPMAGLASEAAANAVPEETSLPTGAAAGSSGQPAIEGARTSATRRDPEPGAGAAPAPAAEYLRSADIPGVGPIELGGIAWSGDRPFALLNGRVVRPGDSVSGLMVEEIQPNTVRLSGKGGDLVFKLK